MDKLIYFGIRFRQKVVVVKTQFKSRKVFYPNENLRHELFYI